MALEVPEFEKYNVDCGLRNGENGILHFAQ